MDHEIHIQQRTSENSVIPVDYVCEGTGGNSSITDDPVVSETVIVIICSEADSVSEENREVKGKGNLLGTTTKVSMEERKVNVPEPDKYTQIIDVKCGGKSLNSENWDGEKVCRICHLNSDRPSDTSDLIQLGCSCKGELGIVHRPCAEAWFRQKGNRCCEICGEIAKNITGIGSNRFIEGWNERRMAGSGGTNSSESQESCLRGQPFCNFLMACLVIAFVLPWFFRVNMF